MLDDLNAGQRGRGSSAVHRGGNAAESRQTLEDRVRNPVGPKCRVARIGAGGPNNRRSSSALALIHIETVASFAPAEV